MSGHLGRKVINYSLLKLMHTRKQMSLRDKITAIATTIIDGYFFFFNLSAEKSNSYRHTYARVTTFMKANPGTLTVKQKNELEHTGCKELKIGTVPSFQGINLYIPGTTMNHFAFVLMVRFLYCK